MLLQKSQIGKTAVILIILILLATLAAMPLFLQADMTGETTPEADLYLPVIYSEDDLTPDPGTDATPTPTSSHLPTTIASPAPQCNLQIISGAVANSGSVAVIGDVGIEVTITNLTTNQVLGSGVLNGPVVGYDCPGTGVISVSPRLDETNTDQMLLAQQTDNPNNSDTALVQSTTDPVPSSTPDIPYLTAVPNCGSGPNVEFKVQGSNWPIDQALTLSWEGVPQVVFQANQHYGSFLMTWTFEGLSEGIYTVSALSGTNGISVSDQVYVPCDLIPTNTPVPTETPTPTSTPVEPYIVAIPDCGPGPNIQFNLQGYNWPTDQTLTLFWENTPQMMWQADQNPGSFSVTWAFSNLSTGIYELTAQSGLSGPTFTELVAIPCEILPTNTPVPTDTPIPLPADLIVGQPQLISTPPIIVYEPVAFEVPITNTGDIDVDTLFFVDLLFDPTPVHYSDVYAAVSGLGGNSSMTLTITSTIGFANFVGTHQVMGWVDSLDQVLEANETNNLSDPFEIIISEPAGAPTNTPVPTGTETISGAARIFMGGSFINQERMLISAVDETSNLTVATTYSDENGFYQFDNLTDGSSYTVTACITIDNNEYFGIRMNRTAPDAFSDIFATPGICQ